MDSRIGVAADHGHQGRQPLSLTHICEADDTPPARWLVVGDGTSIHVRRLVASISERGVETHLAAFQGDPVAGVEWHRLGTRPARDDTRYLSGIPRLWQLMRRLGPNLVIANYLSSYGLMTAAALRLPGAYRPPLVQVVWGSDLLVTARQSRLRAAMARFALSNAALVAGTSEELLQEATRLAPTKPVHRFILGPPASLLHARRRKERLILSARSHIVPMRVDVVIAGFLAAGEELAEWKLVVAGHGPETGRLRALAGDDPRISFVSNVPQDEWDRLMLRTRILVSVPKSDGTSSGLVAGLAAGVRPLVNDLPPNREWVSPDIGVVVPRDPTAREVAEGLIRLSRERFAGDPRARVSAASWEVQVDSLLRRLTSLAPASLYPQAEA